MAEQKDDIDFEKHQIKSMKKLRKICEDLKGKRLDNDSIYTPASPWSPGENLPTVETPKNVDFTERVI